MRAGARHSINSLRMLRTCSPSRASTFLVACFAKANECFHSHKIAGVQRLAPTLRLPRRECKFFIHTKNPVFAVEPLPKVTLTDPACVLAFQELGRHVRDKRPIEEVFE